MVNLVADTFVIFLSRVSHYLGSLIPQSAARFARLERGHWGGCEIRNHWVRDVLFEEDGTLSKNLNLNLNLNGNLAVMRCAVIALKTRHVSHLSWPTIFELSGLRPRHSLQLGLQQCPQMKKPWENDNL